MNFTNATQAHSHYTSQLDEIRASGSRLLHKAYTALAFYDNMPTKITHTQAHDAANLLRMRIIPGLENDYVNFNTCIDGRIQSELNYDAPAYTVVSWYEEHLSEYRELQKKIENTFESLPIWNSISF